MILRNLIASIAVCLPLVLFAGCGGSGASTSPVRVARPDSKPSQLTVRIWSDPFKSAIANSCGKSFTNKTGIPVVFDTTETGAANTKVGEAIRRGDRPPYDASFQFQANAYLNGVQKLSVPLDPDVVTNLPDLIKAVAQPPNLSTESGWAYVNVYGLTDPISVRTDKVSTGDLNSWADLFDSKWKGSIDMDEFFMGPSFGVASMLGVDPADHPPGSMDPVWKKLQQLRPNIASIGDEASAVRALTTGTVAMRVGPAMDGKAAMDAGAPVDWVHPKPKMPITADAFYVHRNIPPANAYYAEVFINDCLDPANQAKIARDLGGIPVNPAASVPAFMQNRPDIFPHTEEQVRKYAVVIPMDLVARYLDTWQREYETAIK